MIAAVVTAGIPARISAWSWPPARLGSGQALDGQQARRVGVGQHDDVGVTLHG